METKIRVDEQVIKQVLAEFNVKWGDPDFDEVVEYLKLRYLHYQHTALIRGMRQAVFERAVPLALISDLGSYFIAEFDATDEEIAYVDKQMHIKYPFIAEATPEERAEAEKLIQNLPLYHQEVLNLLHDGLSQAEISQAMGMKDHGARRFAAELKQIYLKIRGE